MSPLSDITLLAPSAAGQLPGAPVPVHREPHGRGVRRDLGHRQVVRRPRHAGQAADAAVPERHRHLHRGEVHPQGAGACRRVMLHLFHPHACYYYKSIYNI